MWVIRMISKAKNLTAYGGLLPVATMLEKLGFQQLVEETLTVKRATRTMSMYQFVLGMVLSVYVGFSRLHHLRFLEREPMLTGILKVLRLPPQCTFWRFLASLHLGIARQLLEVQRRMRERVWEAAHVQLAAVTLDTDTTVHTLFGNQMGGRKSYNPKNKGKKSYQPILTFLAETREYISGELRNGDRPTGAQIARHLESVFAALPTTGEDDLCPRRFGLLLWGGGGSLRKPGRAVHRLGAQDLPFGGGAESGGLEAVPAHRCRRAMRVSLSAGGLGESLSVHRPALPEEAQAEGGRTSQSSTSCSTRRSTAIACSSPDMKDAIDVLVWFYNQRAGAENLIKEANNDAGLAAHPSGRWMMNCNHFQLAMLAYNMNCWLMLFNREEAGQGGNAEAYHAGDSTFAVSVSGGQDLAPCGTSWCQLQRPLRRAGYLPPPDGPAAGDRHAMDNASVQCWQRR